MKKITLLLAAVLSIGCLFGVARAQDQGRTLSEEAIVSYDSYILVNKDNSIDVTETITYNTGPGEHHGIYRDIRPYSSQNLKMSIGGVTATDRQGNPYQFQVSDVGGNVRVKVGDPNQTFSGQKTYVISYHASRAVGQLKDVDEIYWNVTGNEWGMPIYKVHASVTLPPGASMVQSACYIGAQGSTNKCQSAREDNGTYVFNTPSTLGSHEGLTIAVGFPKGIVTPYSSSDTTASFFETYWRWFAAALLPILTLIFSLLYWYKKGRDDRPTRTIIPQYDIPEGIAPIEAVGIAEESVTTKHISAEIIYLATNGYIKINQLEERFIGLIKTTDYELIKLKDISDLSKGFDHQLMSSLFNTQPRAKLSDIIKLFSPGTYQAAKTDTIPQGQSVKLSDLKNVFYRDAAAIVLNVLDSLLNDGYYKNLGRMKTGAGRIFLIVFMSIWASGFIGGIGGVFLGEPLPMIVAVFCSIVVYAIVSHFSPAKTEKGVIAKEYILGLKMYLQIAEKDRLEFHNAPEKKPEVFEKLLPYAMVLGVADIWAKEFEGIYVTPPSWYSGPSSTAFSAIAFSHTLGNFSSYASSSLASSPGGGSGGGGSSGGGGGGGGGGSW